MDQLENQPEIQPETPQKPKQSNWLVVLISIIAVIVLGLVCYGVYWYFSNTPFIEEGTFIDTGTLPVNDSSDPTANWQTYRNEEYGFEFKFPGGWFVNEPEDLKDSPLGLNYYSSFDFTVGGAPIEISVKEDNALDNMKASLLELGILVGEKIVDVDGAASTELKSYAPPGTEDSLITSSVYIPHNGQFIVFFDSARLEKTSIEFDQILSTFKFIEPEVDTSDWQTYRNEEYGFELKYPGDYDYWEASYPPNSQSGLLIDIGFRPDDIQGSVFVVRVSGLSLENLIVKNPSSYGEITNDKIEVDESTGIKFSGHLPRIIGLEKDNYTFFFETSGIRKKDALVFDQILSTFKFID